jgi:hypothetical protein
MNRSSSPTASRSCCSVQAAFGLAVRSQWTIRRLWCSIATNTYSRRKIAATATKKSQAMIP